MALLPIMMESSLLPMSNIFISIFLFLLSLLLFSQFFMRRPTSKLKLPPSPPKLPIIGNFHQVGTLLHRSLRALSHKYGPLMLLHFGNVPTLVVSSADMIREIANNHDVIFCNRPTSTAARIFFYGCADIGFAPYGEYWRQGRKVCVLELLSLKRVLSFEFVREEETAGFIHKLRDASLRGNKVNLSEMLIATLNNIVLRCILGNKFEEDDGKSKFGELIKRVMIQFTSFSFGDFFPALSWMDHLTGLISSLKATFGEIDPFLEQVLKDHEAGRGSSSDHSDNKDFVDILFQLKKDGMLQMDLTRDNLKAILLDMFMAGSDTTSSTVEWAMAELLRNESMMKKAQDEVRKVIGKKSRIEVNDMNQMDYLKCVIKETLRLHPPAALIFREASERVNLGGYDIPPKTRVLINSLAIQTDPNLWDRPEEFVPERFENNQIDLKGLDSHYIPFGFGRRGCPGLKFGVFTVEYIMASLLYWFDWKLPGGNNIAPTPKDLDMEDVFGLSAHKKNPLIVIPILYSP
ncbi:phenylacetaldehyde oxime monooxygenase CYP71AN24 [Ziziphus jujuba]|uniref:Phenylacetaldehyde oxime monooxygenase CYP71AN24 n=1 Tax=Ziziphus jujuba TaxID=326968 RepID=A0ABM3IK63_ZIZJJ|nr:phenylacetaldehyde oxime monooxygenase CYP71AN24 [Ziziphus jujuba]